MSFPPKKQDAFLFTKRKVIQHISKTQSIHFYYYEFIEIWNSSSNSDIQTEITDVAFIRYVWRTAGNIKTCEVWYLVYKDCGASIPGKQNIQYYAPTVTPLLTSKACPEIQEDSYWSNPSMNRELITGHFRMHFYVFSLWSSPLPIFLGNVIPCKLLLNVWNPHSSSDSPAFRRLVALHSHEAYWGSLFQM